MLPRGKTTGKKDNWITKLSQTRINCFTVHSKYRMTWLDLTILQSPRFLPAL